MKIDGIEIPDYCIMSDGYPRKNILPEQLQYRLLTKKQWLEDGYMVLPNATPYKMHSSGHPSSSVYEYYLDSDVWEIEVCEICHFCAYFSSRSKCRLSDEFVEHDDHCDRWGNSAR